MIIPVFIPHGGCPERCAFCDQSVSGGEPAPASRVTERIARHLAMDTGHAPHEVAFYGGTFTAMPRARQIAYLEAVKPFLASGAVDRVRIATRPDAIEADCLSELKRSYGLRTVELGAQSFEAAALAAMGRSHSPESVDRAVVVLRSLGIGVGIHVMIGVPGESPEPDELTLRRLFELKPDSVRIHPLLVLAGTGLEASYRAGEFRPISLEQAVDRAARLTSGLEAVGVRVIRLGLQHNEILGQSVVAGPYHPAFGDLVRARITGARLALELAALERAGSPLVGKTVDVSLPSVALGHLKARGGTETERLRARFGLSVLLPRVIKNARGWELEIRVRDPAWPSERGKIQPAQPARGRAAGHRHAQGADDAPAPSRAREPSGA